MSTMPQAVEYAGGLTLADVHTGRRGVVARAPKWWRDIASRAVSTPSTTPTRKPTPSAVRKFAGWVSGIACLGVSRPAYCGADRSTLPEQFTDAGLRSLVSSATRQGHRATLQWGHNGPTLASVDGYDLTFRIHSTYGLQFSARLTDCPLARQVLAELEAGLLGVSIAYRGGKGWTVDRAGYGTVRILDAAKLDHVAILPRGTTLRPAYPACNAAGRSGPSIAAPGELLSAVESAAWPELIRQARLMS